MRNRRPGWIGGGLERLTETDNRLHGQRQIDDNRLQFRERWDRNIHQAHCYQVVRQLIYDLKVDLGRMATNEEKNGNYKTADALTAIRIRLSDEFDVPNVARLAYEMADPQHTPQEKP